MSRLALSCRWLSSAIISVAALSIALLSPRLPASKHVNRRGQDRSDFDSLTLKKHFRVNPIVAFCETVTFVVGVGSVIRNYCFREEESK